MTEKVRTWNETLTMRESYDFADGDGSVYASTRIDEFTSTVGETSSSYSYTYDLFGNIQTITDSAGKVTKYHYDDLQQLVREDNPYTNKTYVYTYDRGGNRTSKTTYTYTTSISTANLSGTTTNYTYSGDRLTAIGSTAITYDALGNPLTYGTAAYTWQNGRQLASVSMNGGAMVYSFEYNDSGVRTSKTVNGIEHVYTLNGSQIVTESWVQNNVEYFIVYLYDESGAPIGMQYRTSAYAWGVFDNFFFEKNLFGDIVAIYNEAGNKIGSYKYDAWGACAVSVESTASTLEKKVVRYYNPFRYRGYYYDTDTGFYYLQSRYYNPQWGRFLNADGYINANGDLIGFNMYAYCSNNPVMYVDYSGEDAIFYWASTLPIVGHAAVFIETSEGWYLIQYAPESGWKPLDATILIEYIGSYNEVLDRINSREDSKYIYMCGDFGKSYSTACRYSETPNSNGYDKKYNLLNNNCLHLVLDLLSKGSFDNPKVKNFINNYSGFIPIHFFDQLSSITSAKSRPISGGFTQKTCCVKE